jgi:hypothetical protein
MQSGTNSAAYKGMHTALLSTVDDALQNRAIPKNRRHYSINSMKGTESGS